MTHRVPRVVSQIKRVLSDVLQKSGEDFGVGIATINDIVVSRDFSSAKVWVSFINDSNPEETFKKLLSHSGAIQTQLYRKLSIRRVPKLNWQLEIDPTLRYKMEGMLDDIKRTHAKNSDSTRSDNPGAQDTDSHARKA